jgi:hypothetical protein
VSVNHIKVTVAIVTSAVNISNCKNYSSGSSNRLQQAIVDSYNKEKDYFYSGNRWKRKQLRVIYLWR